MIKMEDDQNRRLPKWKNIKIKYDQNQENNYSQRNEYHKMIRMGNDKTAAIYWNLCPPECGCENRKTLA